MFSPISRAVNTAVNRSLPERLTHLADFNFIIRMLFYQVTDSI